MRTDLSFTNLSEIKTELLAVLAADTQTGKGPEAKAEPMLLTADPAVMAAAAGVLASGEYKAGANETLLLHAPAGLEAKRLLIVGVGKLGKATVHKCAMRRGQRFGSRSLAEFGSWSLRCRSRTAWLRGRVAGGGRGRAGGRLRSGHLSQRPQGPERADIHAGGPKGADKKAVEAAFAEGAIVGESQNFTRALVNEPGNKLTPTMLGQRAAEMAAEVGLKAEVYSTEKMHELKMGAFWSVSQGSEEPPALIVLRYEPEGVKDGPILGLVGKGITFDTGGISIKPSENMEKMKYDMAGGAAMLGAMRAIALLKPKVRVIGIVCAAENMPDGKAQKPGDVQTAMSGKTIEIINTDAEGRLVLADGLAMRATWGDAPD